MTNLSPFCWTVNDAGGKKKEGKKKKKEKEKKKLKHFLGVGLNTPVIKQTFEKVVLANNNISYIFYMGITEIKA